MGCCRCWKVLLASVGGWQMVVMGNCIKQYSKEGRKSHITYDDTPLPVWKRMETRDKDGGRFSV